MASVGRPMGKLHQDDVRKKIQAGQLIKVLQDHALTGEGEFAMSRMKAIEILLRKSMPDLQSVAITGENGGPVEIVEIRRVVIDPKH
jgi:hypothetical protein